jgi:hypothetical protein
MYDEAAILDPNLKRGDRGIDLSKNVTQADANISVDPEKFFSNKAKIQEYLDRYGIILTMKLFKSHNLSFEVSDWEYFSLLSHHDNYVTTDYFLANYEFEINYRIFLDEIIESIINSPNLHKLLSKYIELCVSNGVKIDEIVENNVNNFLRDVHLTSRISARIWDLCANPIIKLDLNIALKALSQRKYHDDPKLGSYIKTSIEANEIDLTDQDIARLILSADFSDADLFRDHYELIAQQGTLPEISTLKWLVAECATILAKHDQIEKLENFTLYFSQHGIDLGEIFDDYLTNNVVHCSRMLSSTHMLRFLVKKAGLIAD